MKANNAKKNALVPKMSARWDSEGKKKKTSGKKIPQSKVVFQLSPYSFVLSSGGTFPRRNLCMRSPFLLALLTPPLLQNRSCQGHQRLLFLRTSWPLLHPHPISISRIPHRLSLPPPKTLYWLGFQGITPTFPPSTLMPPSKGLCILHTLWTVVLYLAWAAGKSGGGAGLTQVWLIQSPGGEDSWASDFKFWFCLFVFVPVTCTITWPGWRIQVISFSPTE